MRPPALCEADLPECGVSSDRKEFSMIKEFLRKILPASARTSEAAYRDLCTQIRKKTTHLENLIRLLEEEQNHLESLLYETMDPKLYPHALEQWYLNAIGEPVNLADPKTYNEKIQWLKLYDQDPRKTVLSDKYRARDLIREKFGEQ